MNDLKDVEALKKVILGGFDYEEAMKDHGIDQKDVDDLRERLASSKVVPKGFYDKALFLSLVVCENNIEKCKIFVEHFFKLIMDSLEFFHDRDPKSPEIQSCLDNQFYICLPPTPDNCNLIYFKLSNSDPKNYVFDDAEKTLFMFVESCLLRNGPRNGMVFLFDMDCCTLGHVVRPSIASLKKVFKFINEACPFKIRAVHILNTSTFIDVIMAIVKPLVNSELLKLTHFHRSNMNYEKFYDKHIPPSCLPSEYGGDLDTIAALHEENRKSLMKMRDFFRAFQRLFHFELEHLDLSVLNEHSTQF